jgi:hypothetical protein
LSQQALREAIQAWTNIREERPFKSFSTRPIIEGALEGLSNTLPDLEIATISVDELSRRSKPNAKKGIKAINTKLSEIGHQTIPWLFKVRRNLQHLQIEHPPKETYQTTLYVILRDGCSQQNSRYGFYVGETSKSAKEIFEEHINGTRSAPEIQEYGIQLLHSLMWPWQKVPQANRYNLYYESALHRALKMNSQTGPETSGNIEGVEDWPKGFQNNLCQKLAKANG